MGSNSTDYNDFLDNDAGYVEGAEVEARQRFPYAQIDNAKDNRGVGGGLFIPIPENAPVDLKLEENEEAGEPFFKEKTLVFDNEGEEKQTEGIISPTYHLGIIACSTNAQGQVRTFKDQRNDKTVFSVLCVIKEALSLTTPFKINFKGVSAVRMANHLRNFDTFVVGKATQLRKERNPNNTKACRHQFWMPVVHQREQVGKGKNTSWACPIQELIANTIREDKTSEKYSRTGVSTLKKFSDPDKIGELFSLAIVQGKNDERGLEIVNQLAKWFVEFKDLLKIETSFNGAVQAGSAAFSSRPHFIEDDSDPNKATEKQQGYLLSTCKKNDLDWYSELMYQIGAGKVTSPPSDYEEMAPEELFTKLSKTGMSVLIDCLVNQSDTSSENSSEPKATTASRFAAQAGAGDDIPAF